MTDVFGVDLEVDASGMKNGGTALEKLAKSGDKADKSIEELNRDLAKTKPIADSVAKSIAKVDAATAKTTKGFRLQKGASQQLGYQLQDVAVQAQMGINPLTILGQQGSQLAMVLGPKGALIGAVIAISAAVGGVLVKAFGDASDSSEDIKERINAVTDSIKDLDAAQKAFLAQDAASIEKALFSESMDVKNEITETEIGIRKLTLARDKSYEKISKGILLSKEERKQNEETNTSIKEMSESLVMLQAKLSTINAEINNSESDISEIVGAGYDQMTKNALDSIKILGAAEQKKWIAIKEGIRERKKELAILLMIEDSSKAIAASDESAKEAAIAKGRALQTVLKNQRLSAAESAISSAVESGKTELEIENERYAQSLVLLEEYASEKGWIGDKIRETEELLAKQHQDNLLQIESEGATARIDNSYNMFEKINAGVNIFNNIQDAADAHKMAQLERDLANKENFSDAEIALKEKTAKALFDKQKKGDLASIASSTAVAAMTQLAQGNWLGFFAASSAGIAAYASADATEYGGSSAPSGGGYSEPAPSIQNNNNSGGNNYSFTFEGGSTNGLTEEGLIEMFQKGFVAFDSNTEQGGVLR